MPKGFWNNNFQMLLQGRAKLLNERNDPTDIEKKGSAWTVRKLKRETPKPTCAGKQRTRRRPKVVDE